MCERKGEKGSEKVLENNGNKRFNIFIEILVVRKSIKILVVKHSMKTNSIEKNIKFEEF